MEANYEEKEMAEKIQFFSSVFNLKFLHYHFLNMMISYHEFEVLIAVVLIELVIFFFQWILPILRLSTIGLKSEC